jgi:long-chain fatty acid transport protein
MRSHTALKSIPGAIVGLVALLAAGSVAAQVLDEANAGVQFNFTPPGARSLAMGGAFIGLADDATAAYTNPAGLTTLRNPEVGLEVRYTSFTHVFTDAGHYGAPATGIGVDTVDGLPFGEADQSVVSLSYLSYVYAGDGWALAAYRQQAADFDAAFNTSGAFIGTQSRLYPVATDMNLKVANYGLSLAFDLTKTLSLGFGASYYDFSLDALTNRYYFQSYEAARYTPDNLYSAQVQSGSDTDIGFNLGLLWRASDKFWLGAVYRDGPSFLLRYSGTCGPTAPDQCALGYGGATTFDSTGTFNLPAVYGAGLAFKPSDALTFTLDYDRVEYSALTEDLTGIPGLAPEFPNFTVDDGDEYHVGLEYLILASSSPVALRAGAWLDPAHQVRYTGSFDFLAALWAPGAAAKDEWHYTAGIGVSISGKYQVDFAFDLSDRVDTLSLSGVYRF